MDYKGPKNCNRDVEILYKHQKNQNSKSRLAYRTFKTYNLAISYISQLNKYSTLKKAWQLGIDKSGKQKYKIPINIDKLSKQIM